MSTESEQKNDAAVALAVIAADLDGDIVNRLQSLRPGGRQRGLYAGRS